MSGPALVPGLPSLTPVRQHNLADTGLVPPPGPATVTGTAAWIASRTAARATGALPRPAVPFLGTRAFPAAGAHWRPASRLVPWRPQLRAVPGGETAFWRCAPLFNRSRLSPPRLLLATLHELASPPATADGVSMARFSDLRPRSLPAGETAETLSAMSINWGDGTPLEVKGSINVKAIAHTMPFDDPDKKKRTAVG